MADKGTDQTTDAPHVVVVGGGIAGLAAAFFLRDEPVRVTVLEASPRLGGQLAVSEVGGVTVDVGADSTYARRPKTARLLKAAGLGEQVVSASTTATAIWTRGDLRALPGRQFMGVPADMDELAKSGMLSDEGVARAREDLRLPRFDRNGDVSVADFVGGRLGREVVDRLVEPFLADAYFGRADELSFEATLTPLVSATRRHASLAEAAGALLPEPAPEGQEPPTGISTLLDGLGTLPGVLADAIRASSPRAALRTGTAATALEPSGRGWRVTASGASGPERIDADAVVVAVPAGPAARLLAGPAGAHGAAAGLAEIPYAGTVIITLAYPREALARLRKLGYSGYRVPAVDGRKVRAVTFSTAKWAHLAGEVDIVRCQAGGSGEDELLRRDDADLVDLAAAEFAAAGGAAGGPIASQVDRWEAAVPQYTVGHLDRIARIRAAVETRPGLAVCGAAYDGVGVGQCVASAQKAADQVLAALRKAADRP
ncbi:protoporphyrinogen oxidase [Streptomyces sp. 184]|uniref:protoporphyrinogen oxidase n=1 Tax=Streptomyces sp. 184 TaxID=1827526 RepID=UPI003891A716